jgi:hypothetical protein
LTLPARIRIVTGGGRKQLEVDMKKKDIADVALKILGVFAFLQAISATQYTFMFSAPLLTASHPMTADAWLTLASLAVPVLLLLVAAIVLVAKSKRLSARMFPPVDSSNAPQAAFSKEELQALAFSVLGVYVVLMAVPKLMELGVNLFTASSVSSPEVQRSFTRRTWVAGISAIVQASLGILLFLRARGLAKFWHALR